MSEGPRPLRLARFGLRARLVGALGLLLTVGLAVFGIGTYNRYATSERSRLDARLKDLLPDAIRSLSSGSGIGASPDAGHKDTPPLSIAGTYAELRDATGKVLYTLTSGSSTTSPVPALPVALVRGQFITVGSVSAGTTWRVTVDQAGPAHEYLAVVAVPTTDVDHSLRGLIIIETAFGLSLLVVLTGGSWLILRRGLRPLEHMADTTRSITTGDLSVRVAPADGLGEVGQLGLAINTMLGELEEAFAERDATEHRLRQFLADASHELRTPLTSIRGFAELFRLGTDSAHVDQAVVARRIEEESTRMKVLVDDLLLLARIDQTRPAEKAEVDLAVLAADACSDAVAADPARPVTLDAPGPVGVLGDRDHLRQAIANLVSNAVKHTPSGTPIDVSARLVGPDGVIVVRDHGAGLDADALVHAFDRFWQADRARVGAGAGLGLSIVEGIAKEHGGKVTATNAVDGGAVFTLRVPVRIPADPR